MKFEDLSQEDQKLVNTDLGEFEKHAAADMAIADEMYTVGFTKLASETADYLDNMFAMQKEASEAPAEDNKMDEASEKIAQDRAAFIERGYFDGLRKLGSDRHGDEMAYLYPFIQEKIAAGRWESAGKWIADKTKAVAEQAGKAKGAVKAKAKDVGENVAYRAKAAKGAVTSEGKGARKMFAQEAFKGTGKPAAGIAAGTAAYQFGKHQGKKP
jgi:hypothetical protein